MDSKKQIMSAATQRFQIGDRVQRFAWGAKAPGATGIVLNTTDRRGDNWTAQSVRVKWANGFENSVDSRQLRLL